MEALKKEVNNMKAIAEELQKKKDVENAFYNELVNTLMTTLKNKQHDALCAGNKAFQEINAINNTVESIAEQIKNAKQIIQNTEEKLAIIEEKMEQSADERFENAKEEVENSIEDQKNLQAYLLQKEKEMESLNKECKTLKIKLKIEKSKYRRLDSDYALIMDQNRSLYSKNDRLYEARKRGNQRLREELNNLSELQNESYANFVSMASASFDPTTVDLILKDVKNEFEERSIPVPAPRKSLKKKFLAMFSCFGV